MANLKSLQEVANTAPGSYISGGFQATVSKVKQRTAKTTGKIFFSCVLSEGSLSIAALSDRDITALDGKLVKFMGMGIKRGNDYNGTAQVNINDKTTIVPVGEGAVSVPPANTSQTVQSSTTVVSSNRIEGITVGMAINKAVDISIAIGDTSEDTIWHRASSLIRLAQKLQAGNLAPEGTPEQPSDEQPY